MAADLSIIERMTPPNTCPMLFACSGIMSSEVSCWLSRTGLTGRIGNGAHDVSGRERRDAGGLIVGGRGVERAHEIEAIGLGNRRVVEPRDVANGTEQRRHGPFASRGIHQQNACGFADRVVSREDRVGAVVPAVVAVGGAG